MKMLLVAIFCFRFFFFFTKTFFKFQIKYENAEILLLFLVFIFWSIKDGLLSTILKGLLLRTGFNCPSRLIFNHSIKKNYLSFIAWYIFMKIILILWSFLSVVSFIVPVISHYQHYCYYCSVIFIIINCEFKYIFLFFLNYLFK